MKWAIMYRFFAQKVSKKAFFVLVCINICISTAILYFTEPLIANTGGKVEILDLAFGFTTEEYYNWLESYGVEGRKTYFWTILFWDTLYPIAYTTLMILTLVALLEYSYPKLVPSLYKFVFVPVLILLVDLVENTLNLNAVRIFPNKIEWLATCASGANQLKWVLVLFVLTATIIGLLGWYANGKEAKKELNKYE